MKLRFPTLLFPLVLSCSLLSLTAFAEDKKVLPSSAYFIQNMNTALPKNLQLHDFTESTLSNGDIMYTTNQSTVTFSYITDTTKQLKKIEIKQQTTFQEDFQAGQAFGLYFSVASTLIDTTLSAESNIFDEFDIYALSVGQTIDYTYRGIVYQGSFDGTAYAVPIQPENLQPENTAPPTVPTEISLVINGEPASFDVTPQSIQGRTMVPLRGIFEALGATVTWDAQTKQITAVKENTTIRLTLDNTTAYINDSAQTLDAAPLLYEGSTLVPARFVAEALGATVDWDAQTKTVTITTP